MICPPASLSIYMGDVSGGNLALLGLDIAIVVPLLFAVAAATAARSGALFARLRLIDGQRSAAHLSAVKRIDRCFRLGVRTHLDKSKAFCLACVLVGDDSSRSHRAV